MSIIASIIPIDANPEIEMEAWQQIFITRPLSDEEMEHLKTIDPEADEDGDSDDDSWLNVSLDPHVKEYLETLS